jgi:hypothetical protein
MIEALLTRQDILPVHSSPDTFARLKSLLQAKGRLSACADKIAAVHAGGRLALASEERFQSQKFESVR